MTYGVNINDLNQRAATYVDKILKGTSRRPPRRAADKVRVHHQSESGKQIGLTIPPNVLVRADRVSSDFRLPIFRFSASHSGRVDIEWGDVLRRAVFRQKRCQS